MLGIRKGKYMEIFKEISDNYKLASSNIWHWHHSKNFLIKLLSLVSILTMSFLLYVVSILLRVGFILDWISRKLNANRISILTLLKKANYSLDNSKTDFIIFPMKVVFISPIALLLGIIPKWSYSMTNGLDDAVDHGYFRDLANNYLSLVKNLLLNLFSHGVLFSIISIPIMIITTPIFILISIIFYALIILDIVGFIVEELRKIVVNSSRILADNAGNNFINTLVNPAVMIFLIPIYIVILFIPKIAGPSSD